MQFFSMLSWGMSIIHLAIAAFLAITFLEASLGKIMNYQGTKGYFENQFKDSFLKNTVGILLPIIMIFETITAFLSVAGFILIFLGNSFITLVAAIFAMITFLMLYFGLRVSKDYPGATGMTTYIIFTLIAIFFLIF